MTVLSFYTLLELQIDKTEKDVNLKTVFLPCQFVDFNIAL